MSVETSQEILGLDPKQEGKRAKQSAQAEIDELYSNGDVFEVEQNGESPNELRDASTRTGFWKEDEVCGNCVYWDGSKNYCSIHKIEKTFDDKICRQFSMGELDDSDSVV
jgi:hypothetical protein